MTMAKMKQGGVNNVGQSDSVLFNSMVKQFVISTIDMVKNNIHEEQNLIDQMLTLLSNKMATMRTNPSPNKCKQQQQLDENEKFTFQKIQSAVEQLNKDSDILSQRLFDLSQTLIQNKISQMEQEKQYIQKSYENKLLKLKHNFQNEKNTLQSELRHYKEKCSILEECLNQREQYILKQSKRLDQSRKQQLSKYLETIESIYEQLQAIKNFSPPPSLNKTELIESYYYPHKYENYSEQYYGSRDELQTQAGSDQYRLKHNQYYTVDRRNQDLLKQRSSSKNRNIEQRYVQVPLPRQNYYIQPHQRIDRSKSTDKEKQDRGSSYKVRPIIIQYQNQPQHKPPMKQSQIYTKRSLKLDNQTQNKRTEQKNLRMQGVQQKLHGLKRKLSRQLKNMKS